MDLISLCVCTRLGWKSRSAWAQSHLICSAACCLTPMLHFWLLFSLGFKRSSPGCTALSSDPRNAHTAYWPLTCHTCCTWAFWHLHTLRQFKSENKNATCIRKVNGQMWLVDCKDAIRVIHWLWRPVNAGITYIFLTSAGLDRKRGGAEGIHKRKRKCKDLWVCSFLCFAWNKH